MKGELVLVKPNGVSNTIKYEIINDCWIPTNLRFNKDGYSVISAGKTFRVSRLVYLQEVDIIPDNLLVRHSCDNPPCINPRHLLVGTSLQNSQDMVIRNRQAKGAKNGNSKLTETDIFFIRESTKTFDELAKEFNVCVDTISKILNNRLWKHLPSPELSVTQNRLKRSTSKRLGENNGNAKLTNEQAQIIKTSAKKHSDLMNEFNISRSTISRIQNNKLRREDACC